MALGDMFFLAFSFRSQQKFIKLFILILDSNKTRKGDVIEKIKELGRGGGE